MVGGWDARFADAHYKGNVNNNLKIYTFDALNETCCLYKHIDFLFLLFALSNTLFLYLVLLTYN